jgi:SAM-dependent methyltransferase
MPPKKTIHKPNFFEAGSPFLVHPLLTDERTEAEVDFLTAEFSLQPGARVLDVGCGFGRHSVALAQRGFQVTGIDPSEAMIAAARVRAAQAGVSVDFKLETGDRFTAAREFDTALCLFTTLGQISAEGVNEALIPQVYNNLRSGGLFAIEVPQRAPTVEALKLSDKFGEGERYTLVTREYHPGEKTVSETFTKYTPEYTRHYLLVYRLYSEPELRALLTGAGFTIQAVYGDYAGTPLKEASSHMFFIARKP